MMKTKLATALRTLIAVSVAWAVPISGTAHQSILQSSPSKIRGTTNPLQVRFRDARGRGLLVDVWINGAGPFAFALDTGAGVSIIARKVAERSQLAVRPARKTLVGGLSASSIASNQETTIDAVALGRADNRIGVSLIAAVAADLPMGIDGILDPLDISPSGYSIDLPNRQLEILGGTGQHLSLGAIPDGGAVVRWIRERGSQRPFVRLGDGRLALLDTGSNFGLAVTQQGQLGGMNHPRRSDAIRDLGGGIVQSHRVSSATISIGDLVLRNVPTDVLIGAAPDTPTILGRDVLYPFRITFDPITRLIAIAPAERK